METLNRMIIELFHAYAISYQLFYGVRVCVRESRLVLFALERCVYVSCVFE